MRGGLYLIELAVSFVAVPMRILLLLNFMIDLMAPFSGGDLSSLLVFASHRFAASLILAVRLIS